MENIQQPEELNVRNVFQGAEYIVPIYQRNYTWEKDEIELFLEDIYDSDGRYYLGSLVVNKIGANIYEVIDGQQRLTTIFLLLSYLKDTTLNKSALRFEARDKANRTLTEISRNLTNEPWYSEEIINGYEVIKRFFESQKLDYKEAFRKKLSNILLIRTQVPQKIDLNHYFEIMNTRGEQLELHEIMKARILEKISGEHDKNVAAKVWDACLQMEKYVQMSFDKNTREEIFGNDWATFCCNSFEELSEKFTESETDGSENGFTLMDILKNPPKMHHQDYKEYEEENERFESIISFPNFILQVNEAMSGEDMDDDAGLDDKKFIYLLREHWSSEEKAKKFIFSLLKYRILFDKYIIKREYARDYKDEGRWSLQRLKMYNDVNRNSKKALYLSTFSGEEENDDNQTKQLRLLESCLRITYTSPKTMHWVSRILRALNQNENTNLIDFLEKYACEKIVNGDYKNAKGFGIERIVFTYLDYVICRNESNKYRDFQFQFRNSIEHFYPQNPIDGERWKDEDLNSLGNLALITVSANSKFSNLSPQSKLDSYKEVLNQSPKLQKMNKLMIDNGGKWNQILVAKHNDEMIALLKDEIAKHLQFIEQAKQVDRVSFDIDIRVEETYYEFG